MPAIEALLPDALAKALGDVIADLRRQWEREMATLAAESRAAIADAKAELAELRSALRMDAAGEVKRAADALAALPKPKDGDPGKSVTVDDVRPLIEAAVSKAVADLPKPKDGDPGKSVTVDDVRPLIEAAVSKAVADLPKPKDGDPGKSVTVDDVRPLIEAAVSKETVQSFAKLSEFAVGNSTEMVKTLERRLRAFEEAMREAEGDAIQAMETSLDVRLQDVSKSVQLVSASIGDQVANAIAALPKPKDGDPGRSVTLDDVRPLIDEGIAKAVAALPKPKDGIGAAGGFIDREGNLILTFTDGSTKDFGRVVGRDGSDADMAKLERQITEIIAALPKPQDGLGFDDLELRETPQGYFLIFARGDVVKEWRLAIPRDCGVYELGKVYGKGDGVTFSGSFWFAQEDGVTEKPGAGSKAWRLAVKRGKNANDPVKIGGTDG